MAKYLYIYRMTNDSGNAPCVFDNGYRESDILSLACCKGGQIRKGKVIHTGLRHEIGKNHINSDDEVYLSGLYQGRVLYVCKITKIIPVEEYYKKDGAYRDRQDCIYSFEGTKESLANSFSRRKKFNPYFHPNDEKNERLLHDIAGDYVLISDCFYYAGSRYEENEIPCEINTLVNIPQHQERKKHEYSSGNKALFTFFMKLLEKESNYNPKEKLASMCKSGCQK